MFDLPMIDICTDVANPVSLLYYHKCVIAVDLQNKNRISQSDRQGRGGRVDNFVSKNMPQLFFVYSCLKTCILRRVSCLCFFSTQ